MATTPVNFDASAGWHVSIRFVRMPVRSSETTHCNCRIRLCVRLPAGGWSVPFYTPPWSTDHDDRCLTSRLAPAPLCRLRSVRWLRALPSARRAPLVFIQWNKTRSSIDEQAEAANAAVTTELQRRQTTTWSHRCSCNQSIMRWLQLGFDCDSTAVRRAFDCLSKVTKVTVT